MATRGQHLVRADRRFATGGLALLRPLAPAFKRVLDKVDAGLLEGGIGATLPDGSRRRLGFRSDGPVASVLMVTSRQPVSEHAAMRGECSWNSRALSMLAQPVSLIQYTT